MRIRLFILGIMIMFLASSCSGSRINQNIAKTGLDNSEIQLVTVTNKRFAGKYTIIDKKIVDRIKNTILKAKDVSEANKLDPDFTFDFYDQTKKVATFNYIAGINDNETGNLIDEQGNIYHINPSIEDEFIKRLLNKSDNGSGKMAPEYYISLIKDLIKKSDVGDNSTIVVDIRKDYLVTRQLTSVEQKRILDSIDERNIKIVFPTETEKWDYMFVIRTEQFMNNTSKATITVTDKENRVTKYIYEGNFTKDRWSYHSRIK